MTSLLQNLSRQSCHIIARQYPQNMSAVNGAPGGLQFPRRPVIGSVFGGGLETPGCTGIDEPRHEKTFFLLIWKPLRQILHDAAQ